MSEPTWPHRPCYIDHHEPSSDAPDDGHCDSCGERWPCPSQQYLDRLLPASAVPEPTDRVRALLNSLGVIGPNIRHAPEDRDDPKRSQEDRDLDAVVDQVEPGSVWCVCGRRWPCEAQQLDHLLAAATPPGPHTFREEQIERRLREKANGVGMIRLRDALEALRAEPSREAEGRDHDDD